MLAGLPVAIALLAQASSQPVDPPALAAPPNGEDCRPRDSGEVVVCAQRPGPSPYRLPKVSEKYERKPIRAETEIIPGVVAAANVESAELLGGHKSERAMIRFKFKF